MSSSPLIFIILSKHNSDQWTSDSFCTSFGSYQTVKLQCSNCEQRQEIHFWCSLYSDAVQHSSAIFKGLDMWNRKYCIISVWVGGFFWETFYSKCIIKRSLLFFLRYLKKDHFSKAAVVRGHFQFWIQWQSLFLYKKDWNNPVTGYGKSIISKHKLVLFF